MWAACTCWARERSACVMNTNSEWLFHVCVSNTVSPAAPAAVSVLPHQVERPEPGAEHPPQACWLSQPITASSAPLRDSLPLPLPPPSLLFFTLSPSPISSSCTLSSFCLFSCVLFPAPSLLSSVVIHLFLFPLVPPPTPPLLPYHLPLLPFLPSSPWSPSLSSSSSCKNSCIFSSFADVSCKMWHKTGGWNQNKKEVAERKQNQKSQPSELIVFSSKGRITPTFLINKLTKHNKSPTSWAAAEIVHKWQFFFLFFSSCFGARVGWSNKSMNFGAVIILLGLIKGAVLGSAVSFSRTDTEEWAGMKNRRDENRADLSFHTGGGMSLIRWLFWSAGRSRRICFWIHMAGGSWLVWAGGEDVVEGDWGHYKDWDLCVGTSRRGRVIRALLYNLTFI